jgi:antitoxin CptB
MTGNDHLDLRRRKARFRAQRRGFREMDLVFSAFADAYLDGLDEQELTHFEALLDVPDWRVHGWFMGHENVPSEYDHTVFSKLCNYRENLSRKV